MVTSVDSFKEHFRGYEDCYTIIGGTACDILMHKAVLEFRATHEIDMILLIENRYEKFASVFWDYIKAGQYKCGWCNSDQPHFYRFTEPQAANYPKMIELFSHRPDFQVAYPEVPLTPLPVSEDISSLSAIMLDDNYYKLVLDGRRVADGISVLDAEYLILFKAKAWLDLAKLKETGGHVNERDLRKHKNDVFHLYAISDPEARIELSQPVAGDMDTFLQAMSEEQVVLRDLGITGITVEEIFDSLHRHLYIGLDDRDRLAII